MIIESFNGNFYYFNPDVQYFTLVHPLFKEFEMNNYDNRILNEKGYSNDEILYYKSKFEFLQLNGQINTYKIKDFDYKLTADDVKFSLQNCTDIMFEVTTACNISCDYCIYGGLYNNNKPKNLNISLNKAIRLVDFILDLKKKNSSSVNEKIMIHFYGGEPLLNMEFVFELVNYIKNIDTKFLFEYGITTNAVVLHKHIEFFVENNFELLISLDGDFENNSYRRFSNGKSTFDQIFENSLLVKNKYPKYFENYVNFNAVLHNQNSLENIHDFFKKNFNKVPLVADLNTSGINPIRNEEFLLKYQSVNISYSKIKSKLIKEKLINYSIEHNMQLDFVEKYSPSIYRNTLELRLNRKNIKKYPTGTCMPFSRSIFLNANGNIMPCTQISSEFSLGKVSDLSVQIDFDEICDLYNSYFEKINNQCKRCYNNEYCNKCVFDIPKITSRPSCPDFQNNKNFQQTVSRITSSIEDNPCGYQKLLKQIKNEN